MKTLIIPIITLVAFFFPTKEEDITVCHGGEEAINSFARFESSRGFINAHADPIPFSLTEHTGKSISFKTAGLSANGYFVESQQKSNKFLFVFHEWYGLNDYIKNEAEKYHEALPDVNILAIDLYDGKVADNREDAASYMQAMKFDRGAEIIEGALKHVGEDAEVATIGWCFGGGWSLQSSLLLGENAKACVIYYGMPEKDVERLKALKCNVLGIFASREKWITPEIVSQFEKDMKVAGKDLEVHSFDAEHAFANPSNPQYDKDATKKAYEYTLAFLKKNL